MVVGEIIEQKPQDINEILKPHTPLMQDLVPTQRVVVERIRDRFEGTDGQFVTPSREGVILAASSTQVLIRPDDDPYFLIDIRPGLIEAKEVKFWANPNSIKNSDFFVPVATSNIARVAMEQGLGLYDALAKWTGTGLLYRLNQQAA